MDSNDTVTEEIWAAVATERRRLADELETLTEAEWTTPTQCDAWTIEDLAAHLITPFEVATPRFLATLARNRFDFDRTMIALSAWVGGRHTRAELVAKLRANAENRWTPPRSGPEVVLTEIVVHSQDIRRPLGRPCPVPAERVEAALRCVEDPEVLADYTDRVGVDAPAPADTP